jgi:ubiquitin-protein ligase
MFGFYPNTQLRLRNNELEEFVYPLQLTHNRNPLFIKVTVPMRFPEAKPVIVVCARVFHKSIDEQTKIYVHDFLNQWSVNSKLLSVLRQMHAEFEACAPVSNPE